MNRILFLLFAIFLNYTAISQVDVINRKGTKLNVDTSKWQYSGVNIFNKNIGNVGIGTNNPLYKLDVNATTNPLRLLGLQLGTVSDSLLTVQNGVVKRLTPLNKIAWLQNGNSYGTLGVLGTLDANDLSFITAGAERFHLDQRGNNYGGASNTFGASVNNGFVHGADNFVETNGAPSFTFGQSNSIDGADNSLNLGEKNSNRKSNYSLLAGRINEIENSEYKFVLGNANVSNSPNPYHYLFGDNNTSNDNGSHLYVFGEKTNAGKEYLMSFGKNVDFANYNNGFALGDDKVSTYLALGTNNSFINANGGNVGIGNNNPLYRLDVTGKLRVTDSIIGNSLRLLNVLGGSATDSVLVINPITGIVRRISPNALPYWSTLGNNNAVYNTNFLGTTNDIPLSLRSNNTTMFELGRRGGPINLVDLTGGLFPYNDANASVAYVRGTGGVSALQFEASGASFYKPIFFTDANGNFKMRGSSAGTDFFELGSAGASNAGSLDFVIGDDGDEPMTFRKYNYSPAGYVEMMRLQGTGLNNNVRAGINVAGVTPNSTLQVLGSVSTAIVTTAAALTLTEIHHTVVVTANVNITLPAANTCIGRIYIIKKTFNGTSTITSYIDNNAAANTNLVRGSLQLQSDGTNWQRIN